MEAQRCLRCHGLPLPVSLLKHSPRWQGIFHIYWLIKVGLLKIKSRISWSWNLYNPKQFNVNQEGCRYFVIKSNSEDAIRSSIKNNIWCSTKHGNRRLHAAFQEQEGKGPVYSLFSVNGSRHFCGMAQMMSFVDFDQSAGVWAQDKWKGQFKLRWIYVKDVPNSELRHIRLENNRNKPLTNSRDSQEVPSEKGKQFLKIMHNYKHLTSFSDDSGQ